MKIPLNRSQGPDNNIFIITVSLLKMLNPNPKRVKSTSNDKKYNDDKPF
jgi:hypothetical protein